MHCPKHDNALSKTRQCIAQNTTMYCPKHDKVLPKTRQCIDQNTTMHCPKHDNALSKTRQCIAQNTTMYCPKHDNVLPKTRQCIAQNKITNNVFILFITCTVNWLADCFSTDNGNRKEVTVIKGNCYYSVAIYNEQHIISPYYDALNITNCNYNLYIW
jgi:hypothetical protein